MKNGLLLFLLVFPIVLLNDFAFDRTSEILALLEMLIPFIGLRFILKNSIKNSTTENIRKFTFKQSLSAGFFYAIWIGFYQYLVTQFFKPEILNAQMDALQNMEILGRKFSDTEIEQQIQLLQSPFYWIISALFLYSILFSLIGLIFGYIYQSKANH